MKKVAMKTAYLIEDEPAKGKQTLPAIGLVKLAGVGEELPQPHEIGIDEAGRGPMLGRVYAAAVILPPNSSNFNHSLMKDSKKFHSEKKIREAANYIKENAIAWAVAWADETVIDDINIRNATHKAMHNAIKSVLQASPENIGIAGSKPLALAGVEGLALLLVDGNDFTPYIDSDTKKRLPHVCIEGGDNAYTSIAAASILAKVSRDDYIAALCAEHPQLITNYDLLKNKGYGTKKHMDGIKAHGITAFHRKTFGICKEYA